jgi:hypothetical protein
MSLSEYQIRAAKPKETPYKLTDGQGLTLLVSPSGARLWRLRYRFSGREAMIALGSYPATSLREARGRRDGARKQIEAGLNPSSLRAEARGRREGTFEVLPQSRERAGYPSQHQEGAPAGKAVQVSRPPA